ncbi:exonuclease domain-containing protein, partial [Schnuerera sp.]|uniref:exonuclease domain-containing protein n=1 Tax=Schnuerera sp. TaxID=2794844 RepID=UPI002BA487B9
MNNSKIQLVELLKRNHISIEGNLDSLFIEKVKLNPNQNLVNIILKSAKIISEKNFSEIANVLKDKFDGLKVSISIRYDIVDDLIKIMNDYWENILYCIEKEIPSSHSWIEYLEYEVNKDVFMIFAINDVINYALINNKIAEKIKNKIKNELNKNVNVIIDDSKIKNNDNEIIEKTIDEEKKISIETLNNNGNINKNKEKKNNKKSISNKSYIYGKKINEQPMDIKDINLNTGSAILAGDVFQMEVRDIRGNKKLVIFNITDLTDSITVKVFLTEKQFKEFKTNVYDGLYVKVEGDIIFDNYSKYLVLMLKSLNLLEKKERLDLTQKKRVELHLHTQMSSMDGLNNFKKLAHRAKKWGHTAIAITDHGVVQGFPEAMEASKELGLKVLYGVEGYLVNDKKPIVYNYDVKKEYNTFVVFDIETTGLSPKNDMITEIGAIKIVNGKIVDEFSQLINPERPIPNRIIKITGITDEMVKDKPTIDEVLPDFERFIDGAVLVAHNA